MMMKPLLMFQFNFLIWPRPLPLFPYLTILGLLNLVSTHHEPRDIHIIKENCRTHSFSTKKDTPITYFFMLSLRLATMVTAYIESWVNFTEYSFTLIPPWQKLMNSTIFLSIHSKEMNLSRKAPLNTFYLPDHTLYVSHPSISLPHFNHIFKLISGYTISLSKGHTHSIHHLENLIYEAL